MRAWVELLIRVSNDPNMNLSNLVAGPWKLINDEYRTATGHAKKGPGPGRIVLPPSTVNYPVPLGDIVSAGILLLVGIDGPFQARLNSLSDTLMTFHGIPPDTSAFPYSSEASAFQPGILLATTTQITALWLSNPSSTTAVTVHNLAIGDGGA
jgi:hypothetical protein